jgi:hypothetical protein
MARAKTMLRNCTWGYSAVAAHHDTTGHPSFSSRWIGCNVTRFRFRNVDKAGCVVYAHARNGIKLKRSYMLICMLRKRKCGNAAGAHPVRAPFPPLRSPLFFPAASRDFRSPPAGCWGLWERQVAFGGAVRRGGAEVGSGSDEHEPAGGRRRGHACRRVGGGHRSQGGRRRRSHVY